MHDLIDTQISRALKNWAAVEQPPANVRSRLLFKAASCEPLQNKFTESAHIDPRYYTGLNSRHGYSLPTNGSFYHPLLWILHLNLTPIRNVA